MASGTINLNESASSGARIASKIVWSATADTDANASKNVTAKIYVRKYNPDITLTIPTSGTWTYSITINGSKVTGSVSKEVLLDWVLVGTHTVSSIAHNSDGTKSITISGSVTAPTGTGFAGHTTSGSGTATFDTIPRASTIDSLTCATKYFTGNLTYKYTPQSSSFYNRCNIALNLDGTYIAVKSINLGKKSAAQQTATVTLTSDELAAIYNELPETDNGILRFTFRTYSDSGYSDQVGDAGYKEISLYIPENTTTKPTATMTVSPVSDLDAPFDSLYIMGRTKVDVNFTDAEGKYGADITGYKMSVGGKSYGSPYTSGYLTTAGEAVVTGVITDSRDFAREYTQTITVISYAEPRLLAASGESEVVAARCDADGNLTDSGTYLRIKAKRSYNKVVSDGVQNNFCQIRFRYKLESASSYSAWTTILAGDSLDSDEVDTGALLGGVLSAQSTYLVQVQAIDDIGEHAYTTITVPTDKVYMHRDGARNALAIGKYVEEDNCIDIAEGIKLKIRGENWVSLGLSDAVSEATLNTGRAGKGCFYRVVNDNHVFVAFNCAMEYAGEPITVSADQIPEQYQPSRNAYALCTTNGRGVARAFVNASGEVRIDHVQNMASAETTSSSTVNWIDGYIDYFIS